MLTLFAYFANNWVLEGTHFAFETDFRSFVFFMKTYLASFSNLNTNPRLNLLTFSVSILVFPIAHFESLRQVMQLIEIKIAV